jgi:hypothetical protein
MKRYYIVPLYVSVLILQIDLKSSPVHARSSHLRRVWGRVQPLCVLCMQSFPQFLQKAVSMTRTHDLIVTRLLLFLLPGLHQRSG